ncbi:MAG: tRNA pseudouridine(38-40) synthase TruA [Ruminococcus sp.]|nr:tRNA pseudouridine(38-40) synthase TruA [Ruminococcus sp.]
MRNFKVLMAYKGTAYHGFQRQSNAYTIQQAVEEALTQLIGEEITIFGCSRTDAKVHARQFCFSFKTESAIPCEGIINGANNILPNDICILSCEQAHEDFHARYCCKGKEYEYRILNSSMKNPFLSDSTCLIQKHIDERLLNEQAKAFVGTHDFKAFCSADCDKENTVREIFSFNVRREGEIVIFTVSGSGFLYNMVRIMVGTLVYIGEGKIEKDSIPELFEKGDRTLAGKTLAPQGLILNRVFY